MKISFSKPQLIIAGSLLLLGVQSVAANVTFNSNSTLILTIDSVINNMNSGNLSDLNISGGFSYSPDDSGKWVSGDGQSGIGYSGANIFLNDTSFAGVSAQQNFNAYGSALDGTVDSYYQSFGTMQFENLSSTDSYTIQVSLSYDLQADINGDFTSTLISLSTFDDFGSLTFDNYLEASAGTFSQSSDQLSDTIQYNFTLNPLAMNKLFADVSIEGNIEAIAPAAVPLPAAGWLMLTGLAFLQRQRRNALKIS